MKKESILYGILYFRCPRCHEGRLFESPNPYDLPRLLKMNRQCSVCEQTFTPEPGFYFGAAYISYMVSVLICVAAFLVLFFLFGIHRVNTLIAVMIGTAVLLAPINFRLSRSIWANIFIRYRP